MDRRKLNLASRILDPIGPLSLLWQTALSAQSENTGIDPAVVVETIQRAISLNGNASHCALVDRRKGLLAKVSPETLDLIDDPALFVPGTPDLFGKKFKKAAFKDLKLSIEMDSLISTSRHGNGRKQFGYIVMLRVRMFRSLIPVLMIKERNIRARNITI